MTTAAVSEHTRVYPRRWRAAFALAMLMLASFLSFLDRGVLNLVVPPLEHDLAISDTQMSLLQGFAFAIFYSVLGIPFGWLADRTNRVRLIAAGIAGWSVMTVFTGLATSYGQLALARMGVGVGEATLMPAAASLIADYFAPHQRGRAYSTFVMAVYIGGGSAYLLGGAVLSAVGGQDFVRFPLIGDLAPWKSLFVIMGLPGLLIALVMLLVREPARAPAPPAASQAPADSLLRYVCAHPLAFTSAWGAHFFVSLIVYEILPWSSTLIVRKFGLPLSEVGFLVGVVQMSGGITGSAVSGWFGDYWTSLDLTGGKLRLALVSFMAVVPSVSLLTLSGVVYAALAGIFAYIFVNALAYAVAVAIVQDIVPPTLRGRTTAISFLVAALGSGLGPLATALGTDYVFHDPAALPQAILLMSVPSAAAGILITWVGLRSYDATRRALRAPSPSQQRAAAGAGAMRARGAR